MIIITLCSGKKRTQIQGTCDTLYTLMKGDLPMEENILWAGNTWRVHDSVLLMSGQRDRPVERILPAGNTLPPAVGIQSAGLAHEGHSSTAFLLYAH